MLRRKAVRVVTAAMTALPLTMTVADAGERPEPIVKMITPIVTPPPGKLLKWFPGNCSEAAWSIIGDMEPGDIEFAVIPKPATFDQKNPIVAVADALLRVTRPKGDLRRHNKEDFCLYFAFCEWDMRERDGTFKITLQEIVDE